MRNRFDRQLEQLNNELINMGSLIEEAIEMAITALMKQDAKRNRESLPETSLTAAAGGKGSASDIRSIEDDNRYGKNRRSCRRYF